MKKESAVSCNFEMGSNGEGEVKNMARVWKTLTCHTDGVGEKTTTLKISQSPARELGGGEA